MKEALRRSGIRQADIAKTCRVTESFVSVLINRGPIGKRPEAAERVWQEIERVTARLFAEVHT